MANDILNCSVKISKKSFSFFKTNDRELDYGIPVEKWEIFHKFLVKFDYDICKKFIVDEVPSIQEKKLNRLYNSYDEEAEYLKKREMTNGWIEQDPVSGIDYYIFHM